MSYLQRAIELDTFKEINKRPTNRFLLIVTCNYKLRMKKVLVLILFSLLMINNSFSQDSFSAVSIDLCNCLDENKKNKENRIIMDYCNRSIFHKHFEDLRTATDISDSLELYNLMIRKIQSEIIYRCEAFRILFNEEHASRDMVRSIDFENCKKYRYGNYHYFMRDDSIKYSIYRSKKRSKLSDSRGNILSNKKIIWLNECDYFELMSSSEDGILREGDTLIMRLVNVSNDTLIYRSDLKGMSIETLMIKADNTR